MAIRAVFFGTPDFALPTLKLLREADSVDLTGVLTQPDRRAGRGKKLRMPPAKEYALEQGIDILQPESLKDPAAMAWLQRHKPEIAVVVAYGGFVSKTIREFPKHGCVNLHPSLLPRYRGAAPMQWAIMNGDTLTGNTTFYLSKGWDDGDMIYQEEEPIHPDDTYDSLSERLSRSGARLMLKSVEDIAAGTAPRIPQPEEGVVFAPLIQNEDAQIDWDAPAGAIHNKVRGLCSVPGAFTFIGDVRMKVLKTEVIRQTTGFAPGEVTGTEFNTIRVQARGGIVEILEIQPSGKRVMAAAEYLRGHSLEPGTRLG